MRNFKVFLLFLLVLLLAGCGSNKIKIPGLNVNSTSSQVSLGVNVDDLGNVMNGQYYFDSGEEEYYSTFDETGSSHIYMTKNKTTKTIFNGFGWSFAVKDDYLYFSGNEGEVIDGTYNLFRMKKDGSSYERINTGYCFNMYFYDEWLYYGKEETEDNYSIFRSNLDGSNETKVVPDSYNSIIYENKLYYQSNSYVYVANPDGTNPQMILGDAVTQFIIGQGKIIYLDSYYNIKTADVDGTDIKVVRAYDGEEIIKINSYKNQIFYVKYNENYLSDRMAYQYYLYSVNMDGTNDQKVYEGVSWGYYVNIVNNNIYVLDYAQDLTINKFIAVTYRMNMDGSDINALYRK
jgi:hypothetical protein